jgi:hypothetical protein
LAGIACNQLRAPSKEKLMHVAGINWVAVLVAAAAFFAIGFVIHMRLVDLKAWNAAKHVDEVKLSKARMASGMILPLATAIGLAVLFSWADVSGVGNGVKWSLVVALASGLPVLWYNWFYGTVPLWIFAVDSAHQLIGHAVAGAILAGWR